MFSQKLLYSFLLKLKKKIGKKKSEKSKSLRDSNVVKNVILKFQSGCTNCSEIIVDALKKKLYFEKFDNTFSM